MSIMTGSTQTAPAPPAPQIDEPKGAGSRQRVILLAGSGLALIVVAALAYFFLLSGGSDVAAGTKLPTPAPKAAAPSAAAKPSTPALRTFAGQTARNPFKSLAPGTGTGSTGTTGTTGTSGSTGTTTGSTGSTGSAGATGASVSSVPLVLTLKSVSGTSSASVSVYNKSTKKTAKYSPQIGDTFGTYFRLTGFLTDTKTGAKAALVEYGDTILTLLPGTSSTVQ